MMIIVLQLIFISLLFEHFASGQQDITDTACSSNHKPALVTQNNVSLQSPGYPNHYDNYRSCEWIMRPAMNQSKVMHLDVQSFETERRNDVVRVYNSTGQLLLSLSGSQSQQRFVFFERELRITFTSNDYNLYRTYAGFLISYEVEDPCSPNPCDVGYRCEDTTTATDKISYTCTEMPYANVACNPLTLPANITGVSALIQPLGLRDREYCFWMYYPHLGSDIESVGIYMRVNNIENLENGQLVIYSGEGKDGEVLFTFNGRETERHPSCAVRGFRNLPFFRVKSLSIEYFGDIILNPYRYFNITVFQEDHACTSGTARQIHVPSGSSSLQSPGYPYILPEYLSCSWVITTLPGQTISIDGIALDMTVDQYCDAEYLEILDGDGALDHSFGRFCNVSAFHGVNSTGNSLQVILRSDYSFEDKKGFKLDFTIKV